MAGQGLSPSAFVRGDRDDQRGRPALTLRVLAGQVMLPASERVPQCAATSHVTTPIATRSSPKSLFGGTP